MTPPQLRNDRLRHGAAAARSRMRDVPAHALVCCRVLGHAMALVPGAIQHWTPSGPSPNVDTNFAESG
jgi:hypothetical protein